MCLYLGCDGVSGVSVEWVGDLGVCCGIMSLCVVFPDSFCR